MGDGQCDGPSLRFGRTGGDRNLRHLSYSCQKQTNRELYMELSVEAKAPRHGGFLSLGCWKVDASVKRTDCTGGVTTTGALKLVKTANFWSACVSTNATKDEVFGYEHDEGRGVWCRCEHGGGQGVQVRTKSISSEPSMTVHQRCCSQCRVQRNIFVHLC